MQSATAGMTRKKEPKEERTEELQGRCGVGGDVRNNAGCVNAGCVDAGCVNAGCAQCWICGGGDAMCGECARTS